MEMQTQRLIATVIYHTSSNRLLSNSGHPQIVAAPSKSLEQNKYRPRIVAAASKYSTHTRARMISDDSRHASARTVHVILVIPMADSRTERLCMLLTASGNCHNVTRTYLIQL